MGTFAKKLYTTNSIGVEETALIYSRLDEVGNDYMYLTVDNTEGYIPLVSTSDTRATSGRVTKNGITYAIASTGIPEYGYTKITAAGAGTFTVPNNITKLRVTCVGGGAGAFAVNNLGTWDDSYTSSGGYMYYTGNPGVATTFGSVSARGGTMQKMGYKVVTSGSGENQTTEVVANGYILSYGYNNGKYSTGHSGWTAGGAAVPLVDINGTTVFSAGGGGGVSHSQSSQHALSGASGYRTVATIDVTPRQVISYSVGRKGYVIENGSTDTNSVSGSTAGSNGGILVEYGLGIQ